MAGPKLPNPLDRRHLLEGDLSQAQALRTGLAYLEEGRSADAVAFLAKAEASDQLEAIAEAAIRAGDAFLLQLVASARGEDPGGESWLRLAEAAQAAGKSRYVEEARRRSERVVDRGTERVQDRGEK